jgi:pimeloyl-ACP methyl ester carboxylesterase
MNQLQMIRGTHAILGRIAPTMTAHRARELFLTPRRAPERPWEAAVESSGTRSTLTDGTSVLRFGGSGRRVLMLHGWEGRATQFGPLASLLVPLGYELLALDAPAHGRSPGTQANLLQFAGALLSAQEEFGPFHAVVGHSMGGGAATLALARGLRAERAVLLGAPASIAGVLARFGQHVGLPSAAQARFVAAIETHVGVAVDEVQVDAVATRLTQPALVVHDRDDREVPFEDGVAIARAWRGANFLVTEGLGHRRVLRDESVLGAIARFVARDGDALASPHRPAERAASNLDALAR